MNISINLLPAKKLTNLKEEQIVRYIRLFSMVILFVVAMISVIVFSLKLQSPLTPSQKAQRQLLSDLSRLNPRLVSYYTITDRTRTISDILKKRNTVTQVLDFITTVIPQGANVQSFRADKSTLSLVVVSASLIPINGLLEKLAIGVDRNVFKSVTMDSLTYDGSRNLYVLNLKATLQ